MAYKSYQELRAWQKAGGPHPEYLHYPARAYVPPFKMADNLWYVGDRVVCSHIIDTGEGLIMFDSSTPQNAHLLIQAIWAAGLNPGDIKYLIHSHEHMDHIGCAEEFRQLYGCKLAISKAGAEVFRNHPERTYMDDFPSAGAHLFVPDIELEDGQEIQLGNTTIRCVLTPGHSAGVMSFFFAVDYQGERKKCGYFGGMGFNTLYKEAIAEENRSLDIRRIFLESIDKVIKEPVDIVVGNHPNNNDTFGKAAKKAANPESNPFIDADEWQRMLMDLKRRFVEFIELGY